ncbi:hypothetical protein [Alistipes senegalensis]|uniref:hypothetical protein n=1 Tax=Alistipes senegalensis TaxID=1288121 RepID=UPI0013ED933B|nr:hypothetical protein [Alistipes senegalensis]
MDWQDYIVGAIGIAAATAAALRLWRLACGKRRGGCASCASEQCPLKKHNRKN